MSPAVPPITPASPRAWAAAKKTSLASELQQHEQRRQRLRFAFLCALLLLVAVGAGSFSASHQAIGRAEREARRMLVVEGAPSIINSSTTTTAPPATKPKAVTASTTAPTTGPEAASRSVSFLVRERALLVRDAHLLHLLSLYEAASAPGARPPLADARLLMSRALQRIDPWVLADSAASAAAASATATASDAKAAAAAALSAAYDPAKMLMPDVNSTAKDDPSVLYPAFARFLGHALATLSYGGEERILPCSRRDATLPRPADFFSSSSSSNPLRLLVAGNLFNSELLMPNYQLQLLRFLVDDVAPGQAYVSLYESGSADHTPQWLSLFAMLLEPAGVPFNLTIDGVLLRRGPKQDRISFLAAVRNAVIAPSFSGRARREPGVEAECRKRWPAVVAGAASGVASASASSSQQQHHPGGLVPAACFDPAPTEVLFLNDVFFCADDLKRLVAHSGFASSEAPSSDDDEDASSSSPPLLPPPTPHERRPGSDIACALDLTYLQVWEAAGADYEEEEPSPPKAEATPKAAPTPPTTPDPLPAPPAAAPLPPKADDPIPLPQPQHEEKKEEKKEEQPKPTATPSTTKKQQQQQQQQLSRRRRDSKAPHRLDARRPATPLKLDPKEAAAAAVAQQQRRPPSLGGKGKGAAGGGRLLLSLDDGESSSDTAVFAAALGTAANATATTAPPQPLSPWTRASLALAPLVPKPETPPTPTPQTPKPPSLRHHRLSGKGRRTGRALLNSRPVLDVEDPAMTAPALLAMASALPVSPAKAAAEAERQREAVAHAKSINSMPPEQQKLIDDLARNFGVGAALFYDRWVARGSDGRMFDAAFPYVQGRFSQRVADGRPVPVQACWNGLARLRAEPFARGLRFRRALLGECNHGECSLVADDFARMGFGRALVDPTIVASYAFLPKLMMTPGAPVPGSAVDPATGLPRRTRAEAITRVKPTTWADIEQGGQQIPWLRKEREAQRARLRGDEEAAKRATLVDLSKVECCPKHFQEDAVPFQCVPYDVLAQNYTALWFEQCDRGLGVYGDGGGDGKKIGGRAFYAVGVLGTEPHAAPMHGHKGERHEAQEACPEW